MLISMHFIYIIFFLFIPFTVNAISEHFKDKLNVFSVPHPIQYYNYNCFS